jgi:hypothetical protein
MFLFGNNFLVVYYCNVLYSLFVKIDKIKNIKMLTLRCQTRRLIFLAVYGLWLLNNVVFILGVADLCGVWVFLPLCDLLLVFLSFLFCCVLHYDLWVCDVSVLFVVLC